MDQSLNITVVIPEEYVLVTKVEWEEMLDQKLKGKQWNMKDLEKHTRRSNNWLKENTLYPNRQELDIKEGGFVRYPKSSGSPWKFGAYRMGEWLEAHIDKII